MVCSKCGQITDRVHTNNYQIVRDLSFSKKSAYLKINRRQMRCPHCQNKFTEELDFVRKKGYILKYLLRRSLKKY